MLNVNVNNSKSAQINTNINQDLSVNINLDFEQQPNQTINYNQKDILYNNYKENTPQNGIFLNTPLTKPIYQPLKTQVKPPQKQKIAVQSMSLDSISQQAPLDSAQIQQQKQTIVQKPKAKLSLQKILIKSKLLKAIFDHFCNISYADTKKKTFQQMQKKNQFMSLNRFMIFCKEFNIYFIVKFQLKKQNYQLNPSSLTQSNSHKMYKKEISTSPSKNLSTIGKSKMLQIPVKQIHRFQKKMSHMYKSTVNKGEKMDFENFVKIIQQIYKIYSRNIKQISPEKSFSNQTELSKGFVQNVLFIKDHSQYRQKMDSLKIQFKGSISYHHQPQKRISQKYLNKPLIMHGGRSHEEMSKQLEVYQTSKLKKTQSWIGTQPQMTGLYSKSRVFYKPNPSKIYQTNDVIRMARNEAGRTQTESLFNYTKLNETQKKSPIQKREQMITFSKIFEDKTNSFSEKLDKLKAQYRRSETNVRIKTLIQKQDPILSMYFENEKRTYGDENNTLSNGI